MFRACTVSVPRQGKLTSSIAALDKCGIGGYPLCALTSNLQRQSRFERLSDREAPAHSGDIGAEFFALKAEDWCSSGDTARRHDAVVTIVNEHQKSENYHCYRNRASVSSAAGSIVHSIAWLITGSGELPLVENWELIVERASSGEKDLPSIECIRYSAVHAVDAIGSIFISAAVSRAESAADQLDLHVFLLIRHHPTSWLPTWHHNFMADFIMGQVQMCAERFRTRVVEDVPATDLVSLREANATESVLECLVIDTHRRAQVSLSKVSDCDTDVGSLQSASSGSDLDAALLTGLRPPMQAAERPRDEDLNDGLVEVSENVTSRKPRASLLPRFSRTDGPRTRFACCA
jgi:hypothetical protein